MKFRQNPPSFIFFTSIYVINSLLNSAWFRNYDIKRKQVGKTARTQIILSPETPWTLYNYIYVYSEDNTEYGAKYRRYNGTQNKNQKPIKTRTQCVIDYPISRNPAQSIQENAITVFVSRLYNSLKCVKYIESVKTAEFKFKLEKFLELIPDEPKIPNYVTTARSNSFLDQLSHFRAQGIYKSGHGIHDSVIDRRKCLETIIISIQVSKLT